MPFARSDDGTQIAFATSGAGPALLLVHGSLAERSRWNAMLPMLEPHFTVHVMDRRGRGESADAPAYGLDREAQDIAAVVEAIGGAVAVAAHSYGAVCALEATRHTSSIGALVLYEPLIRETPLTGPTEALDAIETMATTGDREGALQAFFRDVFHTPAPEIDRMKGLPYWAERLSVISVTPRETRASQTYRFDASAFAALRVPTLLVLGAESPPPFKATIELLKKVLPSSKTAILAGQQHHAMVTGPDLLSAEIIGFLGKDPS